jgi:putative ABC transport system permease protein
MLFVTIIKVALRCLWANKLRTFLAMLGIIIGVGAVISMLALGTGVQKQVIDATSAMGTNLLLIRAGQRAVSGVITGTQQTLTLEDAEAIVNSIVGVERVAPVMNGTVQAQYFNKNSRLSVIGTTTTYFPIRNFEIEKGRMFTETEADKLARVAVLGPMTVQNLFGTDEPVGQQVKLNGINFLVIGVTKSKGDTGFFNLDDQAIIPFSTALKEVFGQTAVHKSSIREIDVQGADSADVSKLQDDTSALLRKRHKLSTDAQDDFTIRNQAELLETRAAQLRFFKILLGGIASISLLVGGIGIMNIMLVTVTERTREIGVRKAIGAKSRDIMSQFLLESVLLSSLGGLIGVAAGISGAKAFAGFFDMPTIVETTSAVVSLSFSIGVGVVFGSYPAFRAAQLDPIEALRYE